MFTICESSLLALQDTLCAMSTAAANCMGIQAGCFIHKRTKTHTDSHCLQHEFTTVLLSHRLERNNIYQLLLSFHSSMWNKEQDRARFKQHNISHVHPGLPLQLVSDASGLKFGVDSKPGKIYSQHTLCGTHQTKYKASSRMLKNKAVLLLLLCGWSSCFAIRSAEAGKHGSHTLLFGNWFIFHGVFHIFSASLVPVF